MPDFLEFYHGLDRDAYYGLTQAEFEVLAERIHLRITQAEKAS